MKDLLSLSQERFSARKFTSEAVSQEDLDYIMQCVQLAPSAVNRQPWLWLIVRSAEVKEKLQECYDREWFKYGLKAQKLLEAARPERAEAPSPGHRPGYNGNLQGAL